MPEDIPITEDWLKSVGFKWHQFDRQPGKQWLLWLGELCAADSQDLGIEVAHCGYGDRNWWFCWLRSDCAQRYGRFLHVRHIHTQVELVRMVEGLTGHPWKPENHIYGSAITQAHAERLREEYDRLDRKFLREGRPWRTIEKDESRGGALPEHMQAAIDAGLAK